MGFKFWLINPPKINFDSIHVNYTDLTKCMTFKVVNQINLIGSMDFITGTDYSLCMEECTMILKKLYDKCATLMNKNSEIYGAYQHKPTFH